MPTNIKITANHSVQVSGIGRVFPGEVHMVDTSVGKEAVALGIAVRTHDEPTPEVEHEANVQRAREDSARQRSTRSTAATLAQLQERVKELEARPVVPRKPKADKGG